MANQTLPSDDNNRDESAKYEPSDALRSIWQEIADAFQTSALASHEDYKLKSLVDTFELSDSLLNV